MFHQSGVQSMGLVRRQFAEHEERLAAIEAIGLEIRALVYDEETDEIRSAEDSGADKQLYARAFQAWAAGKIIGTANEVFDAVEAVLEQ
jgi:hypothetical protein